MSMLNTYTSTERKFCEAIKSLSLRQLLERMNDRIYLNPNIYAWRVPAAYGFDRNLIMLEAFRTSALEGPYALIFNPSRSDSLKKGFYLISHSNSCFQEIFYLAYLVLRDHVITEGCFSRSERQLYDDWLTDVYFSARLHYRITTPNQNLVGYRVAHQLINSVFIDFVNCMGIDICSFSIIAHTQILKLSLCVKE